MPSGSSIIFYGGVNEIGGNKILLEDRGTRIFLDFGKSFKARYQYYDSLEKPRVANGIGDLLTLGILPEVKGIYREDLLGLAGKPSNEDRYVDAVILSHAHSDHADYVSFLREDIPIWMGATSKDIIESIEDERNSNMEYEITAFKKRPIANGSSPVKREIRTFTTESKHFSVDSIDFEPVHVDHSLPGCYGFIIHTSSATIVYSGDLRLHGNKSQMTKEFMEKARQSKPDIMLCEGTRIDEPASLNEADVLRACRHYVEQAKESFIFADYSYKDIDRFNTFYSIAKETGRKLLIGAKTARYLKRLAEKNTSLEMPPIHDDHMAIYMPRKRSGRYEESDYDKYDKELYSLNNVWTAEDVGKNQSKVIMSLGSYYLDQLIDIRPRDGLYIHSTSEPFNEEGELDEARMRKWMEKFELERVHAHCSGHASGADLNCLVNTVQPKVLMPIHTEHPRLFKLFHGGIVKLPEPNKLIETF